MKVIVTPHLFENNLIISLSKDWITLFDKIPQFIVKVNSKNKLVIETIERVVNRT